MPLIGLLIALWIFPVALASGQPAPDLTVEEMKAENRVALVIGNGAYQEAPLRNPVHDADSMAAALTTCGFRVIKKLNCGAQEMEEAIRTFGREIQRGGVGLFYYAGHGIQVEGRNYLVPVGAQVQEEHEVKFKCIDAGLVLEKMESAGNRVNIVILDACRNNPFARSFRSNTRGLVQMDAARGSLLAYATAPGSTAADGEGKNGLYTSRLVQYLQEPGLQVEEVFKNVRREVMAATGAAQVPWESTSLTGSFYFMVPEIVGEPSAPPPSPEAEIAGGPSVLPSPEAVPIAKVSVQKVLRLPGGATMAFVWTQPGMLMMRSSNAELRPLDGEGPPWKIRRIEIRGTTKTREKVLRREIELQSGDIFENSLLQESQRRLYLLNLFKEVQVLPVYSPNPDDHTVDLTFQVEERPTATASMGTWYNSRDKLGGTIGLQIPNLWGAGRSLDLNWEFGTQREMLLVGFTEPWLFDTSTSFSVQVYTLTHQYFNSFDHKSNSASLRVGRRLRKLSYSTVSFGYQLHDDRYSDFQESYESLASAPRYQPRTTSSFGLEYQRDTRDMPMFPSKGTLLSYQPKLAASFVGSAVDFHRHELIFNYYRPSFWHFVWSLETKVAAVQGFSNWDNLNLPFFDRFTPGGVDWWDGQVRGYPDASLGPRVNNINIGGRAMVAINLEYRALLSQRQQFYGLLFADAGNSWDKTNQLNPQNLRRSVGFGFRLVPPMLRVVGLDFGYGFDRRKVDGERPGWITHFQFGPRVF